MFIQNIPHVRCSAQGTGPMKTLPSWSFFGSGESQTVSKGWKYIFMRIRANVTKIMT